LDDTAEPARPLIETQLLVPMKRRKPFVVRESEVERAKRSRMSSTENRKLLEEQSGGSFNPWECRAVRAICELARLLGYNAAKTKMLVGQWRLDLVGLERKLQHDLDEGPQHSFSGKRGKR